MSRWGEKEDKKTELFNNEIMKISEKYSSWFETRKDVIHGTYPDRITNHCMLVHDGINRRLDFPKWSTLPKEIQAEITEAFLSVFSSK